MSWSVNAIGKPEAVAKEIERQFAASSPCREPEETVRQAARTTIASILAAETASVAVQVQANGHQSDEYSKETPTKTGKVSNTFSLKVDPIHQFVE